MGSNPNAVHREPWNKDKIVGQRHRSSSMKSGPFSCASPMESPVRELALFNLGINSELRGCNLVSLRVWGICRGDQIATRAVVL